MRVHQSILNFGIPPSFPLGPKLHLNALLHHNFFNEGLFVINKCSRIYQHYMVVLMLLLGF